MEPNASKINHLLERTKRTLKTYVYTQDTLEFSVHARKREILFGRIKTARKGGGGLWHARRGTGVHDPSKRLTSRQFVVQSAR